MYKLYFYVPETHLEVVKQALFSQGAGKIGDYDCCAWQTLGRGEFRALSGSQPYLGKPNELDTVPEYKVELVCTDEIIEKVVTTLKEVHPYQAPAYGVWKLEDL